MADVLEFDVADFTVLETFTFEEIVQRPEILRFFTLEEQLLDYFEARLPKGELTQYKLRKLEREQDRVKDAYLSTVEEHDGGYDVKRSRTARMPEWIHPLVDSYELTAYDYKKQWAPLFSEEQRNNKGYYNRMILAIPRPYQTSPSENTPVTERTYGRTDEGKQVVALGDYAASKTIMHEDGSKEIVEMRVSNTKDDIRIQGYSMDARKLELPNPLDGHPFLESVQAGKLVTNEPFEDVYPSVEAILTHAVPTTNDPFGKGQEYLKLYDVKLQEIPWSVWKQRFPPVDVILKSPPPVTVKFPKAASSGAPSEDLQKMYGSKWVDGVHPRYWMTQQEDAGVLVEKLLLSMTNNAGLLNVKPLGDMLEPHHPESSPEECIQSSTFESFINGGVYRSGKCVPVGAIHAEQNALIVLGRKAWTEGTEMDILKKHQDVLKGYRHQTEFAKMVKYASHPTKETPELRKDILLLLNDPERTDTDKLDAAEVLLKDIVPAENLYLDADGSFLVCQHTIATLKGEMAKDLNAFYRKWTASDQGFRVCKTCGERIGQVFTIQDEFDSDGRLVVSQGVLDEDGFRGKSQIDSFANSLKKLSSVFLLKAALDSVFYMILSFLQVLPEERQLIPVLHLVRRMSASFKEFAKAKKFSEDMQDRVDGTFGFVGAIVLLQTHRPFLVPRRSIGSRPMVMSGFPRDTDDVKSKGIIDTLLFILKEPFESYSGSFKGPIVPFLRYLISKESALRTDSEKYLKSIAAKEFKAQFEEAKERYLVAPPLVETLSTKRLPILTVDKKAYKPTESLQQNPTNPICMSVKPMTILQPKRGPNVSQAPAVLWEGIKPSPRASINPEIVSEDADMNTVSDADIRRRLQMKFPGLKLPTLSSFLNESNDGIGILSLLQRLIDILMKESGFPKKTIPGLRKMIVYLNTQLDASLLRDVARGLVFELLHTVSQSESRAELERTLQTALRKDIVLRMILLKREDADKTNQVLRAKERETFKSRMREMDDSEREVTKQLLDIGLAGYIITNEDRKLFAKEDVEVDQDEETLRRVRGMDENLPEEGPNADRDLDAGEAPLGETGQELETDFGDYGDRAVRNYGDQGDDNRYDFNEGFGV